MTWVFWLSWGFIVGMLFGIVTEKRLRSRSTAPLLAQIIAKLNEARAFAGNAPGLAIMGNAEFEHDGKWYTVTVAERAP